ncbi:Alpha-galactosidase [Colletotrichum higginsianum IMI 349063]|uniref:Alpha-galactosidase n=2 Tax=Colletotrichum higginsianum TaxID=80884 RepID=A0A1B7YEW6_COLHI|nr:Alpha-galactosidase [Colletotrichum higginsianum IMI 349063]OBR10579.1 Alpha-galactosidase [Colletotrichum higginsianum IMI 349063]TIC91006.1 putative alpha-galactosidase D [Colletotrichum higginsianum]
MASSSSSVAFALLTALAGRASARTHKTPTPQMGWNSYNYYNCYPNETIIKQNAHALVDTGLAEAGYTTVTTDCGWPAKDRAADGQLVWNPELFPSGGGKELGDYIHNLGLKYGVYSGGGYFQCGSTDQPASLNHELTDAKSFAAWGADSLKYDNCYAVKPDVMVDFVHPDAVSPDRFETMADALNTTDRDILYQVCQWGTGTDLGIWAPKLGGNSWRISNDIYNGWRSIWRIANQVVPFYKHTGPGAFPDMDMLLIGLNALSIEEEKFHMGMWAINKSPLTLGAPAIPGLVPDSAHAILTNREVIALNQDPLARQTELVRRYTEEEWDVWAGELSGSRLVVGLANWRNDSQSVRVDLAAVLGVASAAAARDVWAAADLGPVSGTYETTLAGHELKLLVLSDIVAEPKPVHASAGYYTAATDAALSGSAVKVACADGQCLPSKAKVGNIGSGAAVRFEGVAATSEGAKLLGVDFINYDVALDSAWGFGSNTRNLTVSVNGGAAKRWAFPISGGNWFETGRLLVEVDGFRGNASNTVEFKSVGSDWAPDLVGFEVFERS